MTFHAHDKNSHEKPGESDLEEIEATVALTGALRGFLLGEDFGVTVGISVFNPPLRLAAPHPGL
jgi:hypothetical protein